VRLFLTLFVLMLASCSPSQLNEKLSTPQERELALKVVASLRNGDIAALKDEMEPRLFAQTIAMQEKTQQALPRNGVPSLVTVSSNMSTVNGKMSSTKALNYELGSGNKWASLQIVLQQSEGKNVIIGWYATPANVKPTTAGNFDFHNKGVIHYFWIIAMVASVLTVISAFILAIRSKGIRNRWLWILGSLVGFVQFNLNWTTGVWGVQPISFSLFGGSFLKASPFDAWVLSFALPIVAIIFLFRRSGLIANIDQSKVNDGVQTV
jgi:hypothetical protein